MKFKKKSKLVFKTSKACKNQAWDFTYLSNWSALYSYEEDSNEIYLFATHDKELKELFIKQMI